MHALKRDVVVARAIDFQSFLPVSPSTEGFSASVGNYNFWAPGKHSQRTVKYVGRGDDRFCEIPVHGLIQS